MKSNLKFFKRSKNLSVDKFFKNVLYDEKYGYYNSKYPFGEKGDFITAPNISILFSEMIAIWIVSTWESLGKPKKINIVELGPGDGSLIKTLIDTFKKFPEFDKSKKIYLYELSKSLKKIQKKRIGNAKVFWINNFKKLRNGPVIFFGNEFFDAIPIKQFKREKNYLMEKHYTLRKDCKIIENFKISTKKNSSVINSYKTLKKLKFIEFPESGFSELRKVIKKISELKGCILLIDYGYFSSQNKNTLQSVFKHQKNKLLANLGRADITSLVNFSLLKEFFLKNDLKVENIISQKEFLKNMGILSRAEIIAKDMKFTDQTNLYLRLKRLLSPKLMGELFKVILVYKCKNSNYLGFN